VSGTTKDKDYVGGALYGQHMKGDSAKFANSNITNRTSIIQRMHIRELTELAVNRFKWTGLPEEIDPRFLEMTLFYRALAVFFKDGKNDKYFVMRGAPSGPWDITDTPTQFQVTGNQFTSRLLSTVRTFREVDGEIVPAGEPECVPIWANYLRVPDLDIVLIYATKFAELDVTIEINSRNARRNKIVAVDENMRLSAVNINRQIDAGDNFIQLGQNGMQAVPVALDLGIHPDSIEKLHILKVRLWNECMGMLGINNANQDKKERLVADEVDANNAQVEANRAIALNARQEAARQINKLYNLNVEVGFHSDDNPNVNPDGKPQAEPTGPRAVKTEDAA
jgi:hypothetical protein